MNELKAVIADDDESILWVLERFFIDKEITVLKAADGVTAVSLLKSSGASLAVVDINMPGKDGLEVIKEARQAGCAAEFIVMTAESTMTNAVEAVKAGAFDYITKPFDLDELALTVDRALENMRLKEKVTALSERLKKELAAKTEFIGKSKAVQTVFKTVAKVAPKDVTVLILGPSGSGKELLAKLIHANSPRSAGPFVAINSAAVPRDLMESELFGFEKGAFTGAVEAKKGKFELADKGTLFLDEIGDMSPDLQARLLRAIQEKEFFRVGGKETIKVDVRIVTATNQNLEKAVAEKRFREDLFYRINGVTLELPALKERKTDIPLLADHFVEKFSREFSMGTRSISQKALAALEAYHWPGNVRELENVLRRALLLSPNSVLSPSDLNLPEARQKNDSLEEIITAKLAPFIEKTNTTGKQNLYDLIMPFIERPLIKLVLEKNKGNQLQAAEVLGINRNTLRKKIKALKINIAKTKE